VIIGTKAQREPPLNCAIVILLLTYIPWMYNPSCLAKFTQGIRISRRWDKERERWTGEQLLSVIQQMLERPGYISWAAGPLRSQLQTTVHKTII